MKKIFRMQYEPCLGACYSPNQEFFNSINNIYKHDRDYFDSMMIKLLSIHDQVCGNESLAYMIDYDTEHTLYIASFLHYGQLDLFAGPTVFGALEQLIHAALEYYQTDDYRDLVMEYPGKGHEVCDHAEGDNLEKFIRECSNI